MALLAGAVRLDAFQADEVKVAADGAIASTRRSGSNTIARSLVTKSSQTIWHGLV